LLNVFDLQTNYDFKEKKISVWNENVVRRFWTRNTISKHISL